MRKGDQGSFGFDAMYVKAGDQLEKLQKYAVISQELDQKYAQPFEERKHKKDKN